MSPCPQRLGRLCIQRNVFQRTLTKKKALKSDPYVHVAGNLYTVLTPLKAGATKSTIEDCFADEIRNLNLGGKTFNANTEHLHQHRCGHHHHHL